MNTIIAIISKALGINEDRINPESVIRNDLHMDRKDIVSVLTDLENEYDIVIDYSHIDRLSTVSDLEQCIQQILS